MKIPPPPLLEGIIENVGGLQRELRLTTLAASLSHA